MKEIYQKLLSDIPDYKEFLTVDEMNESSKILAMKYPECVSLFEIGKSRNDEPLYCLKIGNGSHVGLMFGCPHPNEPIGTMMLEYLSIKLAENKELRESLDYTWYIVKVWDNDGYRLNENWIKGPYTLYNYSRNFFRPAGYNQVDWTFPVDYKELHFHNSIPETEAMMELINKIKPEFIYSLHNAGFGGVYWYITSKTPELYAEMREAANKQNIPLNLGEPEAPFCIQWAPAVYANLGIQEEYDYLEKYGVKDVAKYMICGTCSAEYAKDLCDAFTLLTELPYFYDKRIDDMSDAKILRKDAVLASLDWDEKASKFIMDTLDSTKEYTRKDNPFIQALKAFSGEETKMSNDTTRKMVEVNPDYLRIASVAEEFDNLYVTKFYKLLSYGMLIRAHEYELDKMIESNESNQEKKTALEKAIDIATKEHKKLADYLENAIDYEVIPIRKLISIQLESGLLVAEYLKQK